MPVGTAARLAAELRATAPAADGVHLAWNPEFLREGCAVRDTLRPDRLVFGVTSEGDLDVLRTTYATALARGVPEVVTDLATAELVKAAANSFLATKISFINAMAEVCEATGADVLALAAALAPDRRIGGEFLRPGLGFGGGCLPKDIRAFVARTAELGVAQSTAFLREVDAINTRCRERAVKLVVEELGGSVADRRVAVLGASFKPGSDDIRDSPALHVATALHRRGAAVSVHDPKASNRAAQLTPQLHHAGTVARACADADLVLLATEWPQYVELDPAHLAALVRGQRIVDTRYALDAARWRGAGWRYRALGRPSSSTC